MRHVADNLDSLVQIAVAEHLQHLLSEAAYEPQTDLRRIDLPTSGKRLDGAQERIGIAAPVHRAGVGNGKAPVGSLRRIDIGEVGAVESVRQMMELLGGEMRIFAESILRDPRPCYLDGICLAEDRELERPVDTCRDLPALRRRDEACPGIAEAGNPGETAFAVQPAGYQRAGVGRGG